MNSGPNAQYNLARPNSLPIRIATMQRKRMFQTFLKECDVSPQCSVLDIGATSDESYESSNYLEAWLENKNRITAVGIDDASALEKRYPGVKFVSANGLDLPFKEKSYDVVHSSAVIEHVGSFDNQVQLIRECARVAKRSFFITTPNRFFPVEFHTVLPFVHWLPAKAFRQLMKATGREFFAKEENLNLMSHSRFWQAAGEALIGDRFVFRVTSVKLLGMSSNLLLIARRK